MALLRTLTARGRIVSLLAAWLLVAGTWWHYPLVAALGLVLALVVCLEAVAVLRAVPPTLRRSVTPLVVVRQGPCEGHLVLHGRASGGLVRTEAADLVDGTLVPISLPAGTNATTEVTYPIPTLRRGMVDVGPLHLRRSSVMGMAARSEEAGDVVQVRVLPRRIPVHAMAAGHRRAVAGGDDSVEHGGTDLVGLHEYTMGDDLRRLHWATSARTGALMVREDAEPAEPHVCVVLDDRSASYARAVDFEDAVELAAALCRAAVERGNPLRYRGTSGRDEIVVPGSATRMPRREARDVEWLLAEIDLAPAGSPAPLGRHDLDVVVAVTGSAADLTALSLALGDGIDTTLCVVDPRAGVAAGRGAGVLVLRAATSVELAALWDQAGAR